MLPPNNTNTQIPVIPAKAGIQCLGSRATVSEKALDPGLRRGDGELGANGLCFVSDFMAPPRAGQKRIRASTCLSLACEASCAAPVFCRARWVPRSRSEWGAIVGAGLFRLRRLTTFAFCPRKSSSPQQGAKPKPGCTAMSQHRWLPAGNRQRERRTAVLQTKALDPGLRRDNRSMAVTA